MDGGGGGAPSSCRLYSCCFKLLIMPHLLRRHESFESDDVCGHSNHNITAYRCSSRMSDTKYEPPTTFWSKAEVAKNPLPLPITLHHHHFPPWSSPILRFPHHTDLYSPPPLPSRHTEVNPYRLEELGIAPRSRYKVDLFVFNTKLGVIYDVRGRVGSLGRELERDVGFMGFTDIFGMRLLGIGVHMLVQLTMVGKEARSLERLRRMFHGASDILKVHGLMSLRPTVFGQRHTAGITQMTEFESQRGPAKGPAQLDAPEEAGSSS
ncbi:hypothetical protein Tco_0742126 [Tanacetum coccineum]